MKWDKRDDLTDTKFSWREPLERDLYFSVRSALRYSDDIHIDMGRFLINFPGLLFDKILQLDVHMWNSFRYYLNCWSY